MAKIYLFLAIYPSHYKENSGTIWESVSIDFEIQMEVTLHLGNWVNHAGIRRNGAFYTITLAAMYI